MDANEPGRGELSYDVLRKIARYGLVASAGLAHRRARRFLTAPYYLHKHRLAEPYCEPADSEVAEIEESLRATGNSVRPLVISPQDFERFKKSFPFPATYFTSNSALRNEKLLEHFIASQMCGLRNALPDHAQARTKDFLYIDVAGCGSPWVRVLNAKGINAIAIDLKIPPIHRRLKTYRKMDATKTTFGSESVDCMSLQCAYEVFLGNDDSLLVDEVARLLKPGGKGIVVPLYMHTHYCGYSSPEYYGKGWADSGATAYLRPSSWGIPFSRKYDVERLNERVVSRAEERGMHCTIHVLRNKQELGQGVYCHFVLEMTKERSHRSSRERRP